MTTVSLRLPDELVQEVDRRAREMRISRAEYIRRAIAVLNAQVVAAQHRQRMMNASRRVRGESMRVNAEIAVIEDAPDA